MLRREGLPEEREREREPKGYLQRNSVTTHSCVKWHTRVEMTHSL